MVEQIPLKDKVAGSSPAGGTLRLRSVRALQKNKNRVEYIIQINKSAGSAFIYKMSLTTKEKTKIIKDVANNEKDTGSSEVQIALLCKELDKLVLHLKKHPRDVHSKRGLIQMVIKRKKLLANLKKVSEKRYLAILKIIGLKK